MRAAWMLVVLGQVGGDAEPSRFEYRETHMGSEFKIVLYTTREADARSASAAAFQRIAALDDALSDYDAESELSKLSERSGGPAVAASPDMLRVLVKARAVAERSQGAFDPTVGPVGRLWRRTRRTRVLPDREDLDRTLAAVDHRAMQIDEAAGTVRLARPGMKLDLGGIAKGFACDEAMAALKRRGITSALVAGAGDIVVSDPPPGQRGWTVGVADPVADPSRSARLLLVRDCAVSTSGDAERFVEIDGHRYSHIVDPRTGVGVELRGSVTVAARDGATADSLATAAFVLGPSQGLDLIEQAGASGLFVLAGAEPGTFALAALGGSPSRDQARGGGRESARGPWGQPQAPGRGLSYLLGTKGIPWGAA